MKLYNGDCLEIMKEIPDKSIDLILTDPPYGTTQCKWDSVIPLDKMWPELERIIKDNGAIVLFGSEPFSSALRMSNVKNYKYDWIWDKIKSNGFLNANRCPMKRHEIISVFNTTRYFPIKEKLDKPRTSKMYKLSECFGNVKECTEKIITEKYPTSILSFSNANQKEKVHPTQKPTDLLEYLIKTYTNKGDKVLDFTMGSGSTGVACVNTNRDFIGIELDKNYFDIAKKRIEEAEKDVKSMLFDLC